MFKQSSPKLKSVNSVRLFSLLIWMHRAQQERLKKHQIATGLAGETAPSFLFLLDHVVGLYR